jgi:NAD(P)H-hydrate epimerase
MDKFVTVAEMRAIEKAADASGHTYDDMMANAGLALASEVTSAYSQLPDKYVLGLVGVGNNGGDTLVALSHMIEEGWKASAYLIGDRLNDPLVARFLDLGGNIVFFSKDKTLRKLRSLVKKNVIILDGLLGTGIRLPLREPVLGVLKAVKKALDDLETLPQIVAVDCPSGVDCDSGDAVSECLPADITVCMAAVKQGLLAFPAYQFLGDLKVVGIGLPDDLAPWKSVSRFVIDREFVNQILPQRPLDAHKGTFGRIMIIAGSLNFSGAALLAGKAAFRCGAGWVSLAVPSPLHAAIAGSFPEATWLHLPHEIGVISIDAADLVLQNLSRVTTLLLGPGFGLEETTKDFLECVLSGGRLGAIRKVGLLKSETREETPVSIPLPPLVIDADGLKLLAQIDGWAKKLPTNSILTPHPGEMSVMTGMGKDEIQANRVGVTESFANEWGHVVVLKGAFTVIAEPGGNTGIIPVASPALARAGTGDILAGLIAGLRAQGVASYEAAVAGAWIHAQAGLLAAKRLGSTAGVLAGDLIGEIPELMPR